MIPDEAIDPVLAHLKANHRPEVAADLLAAAQPLMAIAWDEGYRTGLFDKEYYSHNPNPYRKPTNAV